MKNRLLRNALTGIPFLLVVLQLVFAIVVAARKEVDIPGLGDRYFHFSLSPLKLALQSYLTLGYPIFLKIGSWFAEIPRDIPLLQQILINAGVLVLWVGLRIFGFPRLTVLACVSPLIWVIPAELAMAETLSKVFSIVALGGVFWVATRPRSVWGHALIAIAVMSTYHLHPAFLFMVGFAPIAATVLTWIRSDGESASVLRCGLYSGLASVLPLFLFCILRLAVVGHFGLVSFAGQNTIGIAIELLRPATLERLPPDHRPLAMYFNRERNDWPSARYVSERGVSVDWDQVTTSYVVNVNRIARAARGSFFEGQTDAEFDRSISEFSIAVFRAEPKAYAAWLADAFVQGLQVTLALIFTTGLGLDAPVAGAMIFLTVILLPMNWLFGNRAGPPPDTASRWVLCSTAINFVAVLFFLMNMILIIMVEPPIERYIQAAAFLFPAMLSLILFDQLAAFAGQFDRRIARLRSVSLGEPTANEPVGSTGPDVDGLVQNNAFQRWIPAAAFVLVMAMGLAGWVALPRLYKELGWTNPGPDAGLLDDETDEQGATGLHYAAFSNDADRTRELLASGAVVDAQTVKGSTALHWAALANATNVIPVLLDHGADTSVPGPVGLRPLHLAALSGHKRAVETLILGGAEANTTTGSGLTPLHLAANGDVASVLLGSGADLNARSTLGATPIYFATDRWMRDYFLERHADLESKVSWAAHVPYGTLLHRAVYKEDYSLVRKLLDAGANVNTGDVNEMTPLYYAVWRGNEVLIHLLLDRGADPNAAAYWRPNKRYDLASEMFNKTYGRRPDRTLIDELKLEDTVITPLGLAAFWGNETMTRVLAGRGATLDYVNEVGFSPLHWAVVGNSGDSARFILRNLPYSDPAKATKINELWPIRELARTLGRTHLLDLIDQQTVVH